MNSQKTPLVVLVATALTVTVMVWFVVLAGALERTESFLR